MGGTNNPNNLIELSIEEHAKAHKALYEEYGKEEDRIAWLALSGQLSKKEALILSRKLGRKLTNEKLKQRYGDNWRSDIGKIANKKANEAKQKYGTLGFSTESQKKGTLAALSIESRNKRKATFQSKGIQQGEKNNNFGKCWVYNETLQQSKLILKTDLHLIGGDWKVGRKIYSPVV